MVDFDKISVAAAVPTGAKHGTVGGRVDRRAVRTGEIDPRVHRCTGMEGVGADTEAAGEFNVHLDRLVRGNGDHTVLQLVELLPAVEQGLEAGVADALERTADAIIRADARR